MGDRGIGVKFQAEAKDFSTASKYALGSTEPPAQLIAMVLLLGVRRPGCKADHSRPSNAVCVFMMWNTVEQNSDCVTCAVEGDTRAVQCSVAKIYK
jgi:hypothetical protein